MGTYCKRMPPRCKAPKCAEIKNKCACPNPWTEFLSKNAHKGKTTMAEHSAAYKALKDSGAFVPKAGLNNGSCKSDPVKLCAWKLRRKAAHKDLVAPVARRGKARAERMIKRAMRSWKFSRTRAEVIHGLEDVFGSAGFDKDFIKDSERTEKELLDLYVKEVGLDKHGIELDSILGSGFYGVAVEGSYKGKPAAMKFLWHEEGGMHERLTDIEVHNHKLMCKAFPDMVPKLYKAFKLKRNDIYFDIIVMEKLDIELAELIRKHKNDVKFLRHVARQCKKIIMALREKKIVHGDLHHSNMGYKLVKGLPKLYIIDFSHVYPMPPEDLTVDSDSIWDTEFYPNANDPWPRALKDVGFPEKLDGDGSQYSKPYWTSDKKVAHIPLG